MTDFDKFTLSIEKLQPNSQYTLSCNDENTIDEELFNSINWISENSLTWSQVKAEMDKL
tara:strand:+ start:216 stop:392 length:177 start_codon:yes stop_codon:yes gene_type:complete